MRIFLATEIFSEGEAKVFPDEHITLRSEVMFVLNGAAEGVLHRIAVGQVE